MHESVKRLQPARETCVMNWHIFMQTLFTVRFLITAGKKCFKEKKDTLAILVWNEMRN